MKTLLLKSFLAAILLLSVFYPAAGQARFYSSVSIASSLDISPSFQHVFEGLYHIHMRLPTNNMSFDISIGVGGMSRGFAPIIENQHPEILTVVFPYVQEYHAIAEANIRLFFDNIRKVRKYAYPFIGFSGEVPIPVKRSHPYEIILADGTKQSYEEHFDWSGAYLDIGTEIVLPDIPHVLVGFSFDFIHIFDMIGHSPKINGEIIDGCVIRRPILFKFNLGILIPHSKGQ